MPTKLAIVAAVLLVVATLGCEDSKFPFVVVIKGLGSISVTQAAAAVDPKVVPCAGVPGALGKCPCATIEGLDPQLDDPQSVSCEFPALKTDETQVVATATPGESWRFSQWEFTHPDRTQADPIFLFRNGRGSPGDCIARFVRVSEDAGAPDAGAGDAGPKDAGTSDAGANDAGATDSGLPDAGPPDAGTPDAGPPFVCDAGFTCCNDGGACQNGASGRCVDTQNSNTDCGACGNVCPPNDGTPGNARTCVFGGCSNLGYQGCQNKAANFCTDGTSTLSCKPEDPSEQNQGFKHCCHEKNTGPCRAGMSDCCGETQCTADGGTCACQPANTPCLETEDCCGSLICAKYLGNNLCVPCSMSGGQCSSTTQECCPGLGLTCVPGSPYHCQ